jgi:hypothetical protein
MTIYKFHRRPISLGVVPQCVGDRILHTICCNRTIRLGCILRFMHANNHFSDTLSVRPLIPQLEVQACYVGEQGEGEKALAPLRHHPAVVQDTVQLRPYLELEQMVPNDTPPSYHEHRGGFFTELDDRRIEILAAAFRARRFPSSASLFIATER